MVGTGTVRVKNQAEFDLFESRGFRTEEQIAIPVPPIDRPDSPQYFWAGSSHVPRSYLDYKDYDMAYQDSNMLVQQVQLLSGRARQYLPESQSADSFKVTEKDGSQYTVVVRAETQVPIPEPVAPSVTLSRIEEEIAEVRRCLDTPGLSLEAIEKDGELYT